MLSTAGLGLLLGLSGCYEDGALLRSCYHVDARCGWNQDRDSESESTPSGNTPSPGTPAPAPGPATPTPT
jgi:hypothetical protein